MTRRTPFIVLFFSIVCAHAAHGAEFETLSGVTMGTTYTIKYRPNTRESDPSLLGPQVDAVFSRITAQMSTFEPNSELSRFNARARTDWFPVSSDLALVIETALAISAATGGAFDITTGPLVNLWGFGPGESQHQIPDQTAIRDAQRFVGHGYLKVDHQHRKLRKRIPRLYVDLSGIAKGFAVDKIAGLFDSIGLSDYIVEIGGEVRACGVNQDGAIWRIAIEKPSDQPHGDPFHIVVSLNCRSLATSGDYRNISKQTERHTHTQSIRAQAGP